MSFHKTLCIKKNTNQKKYSMLNQQPKFFETIWPQYSSKKKKAWIPSASPHFKSVWQLGQGLGSRGWVNCTVSQSPGAGASVFQGVAPLISPPRPPWTPETLQPHLLVAPELLGKGKADGCLEMPLHSPSRSGLVLTWSSCSPESLQPRATTACSEGSAMGLGRQDEPQARSTVPVAEGH